MVGDMRCGGGPVWWVTWGVVKVRCPEYHQVWWVL